MKLLEIPKHPWIVHHTNGKSLDLLKESLSQYHNTSVNYNNVAPNMTSTGNS